MTGRKRPPHQGTADTLRRASSSATSLLESIGSVTLPASPRGHRRTYHLDDLDHLSVELWRCVRRMAASVVEGDRRVVAYRRLTLALNKSANEFRDLPVLQLRRIADGLSETSTILAGLCDDVEEIDRKLRDDRERLGR